jgi:hypothetical protein
MKAADLFPQAARSNRTLFYKSGNPVSVKGLYQNLVRRHSVQQIDVAQTKTQAKIAELASVEQPVILQGSIDYKNKEKIDAIAAVDPAAQNGQIFHHVLEGGLFSNQQIASSDKPVDTALATNATNREQSINADIKEGQGQIGVWANLTPMNFEGLKAPQGEQFIAEATKQKPILDLNESSNSKAGGLFRKGGLG